MLNYLIGFIELTNFLKRGNYTRINFIYFCNNWLYSTNHKKISINYFWFILLAGVVGMVLATLIRVEMAYPGIGVLAGDNAQYLTIVSAHGVIMVFFMAMPLLFGFFTNFLLPTQLGVHDVAFPRMNSAAFWFLPASLIVLCQLVCIDRRYQRMNCFNIRELQSIVRRKFFFELLDENVYNDSLNNSLIGLKKQIGHENSIQKSNMFNIESLLMKDVVVSLSQNWFVIKQSLKNILLLIYFGFYTAYIVIKIVFYFLYTLFGGCFLIIKYVLFVYLERLHEFFIQCWSLYSGIPSLSYTLEDILIYFYNITRIFINTIVTRFNFLKLYNLNKFLTNYESYVNSYESINTSLLFTVSGSYTNLFDLIFNKTGIEFISNKRYLTYENPTIKFKVKIGNYLPKKPYEENFDNIFTTFDYKTLISKKSLWVNSDSINGVIMTNFLNEFFSKCLYNLKFINIIDKNFLEDYQLNNYKLFDILNDELFNINYSTNNKDNITESGLDFNFFYYFSNIIFNKYNFLQNKWISNIYFDNTFVNIFLNKNKQLFIWNNWKNLKLQREGWRCRLLVSRNQHSLYKKYIKGSDLLWVVEKNAKDLIPGWAMITPFSSRPKYTLFGKTDIGLWVVVFTLLSSIISCSNFLITYRYLSTLNNRKMRDSRSFFSEAIIVTCWMTILANPMLLLGILMLLSDRHWKTSFFDYSGGGDTVLFQHMFWFFGHPEVYIIIVPCFGFVNTILSFYLRKRISARASLMYSLYTIAFLGFFVWGHHMYMVGLSHTTRMLYSTLTVMISVPAATKLMHWFITFINSTLHFELPLVFILNFIFFFISGGISGMSVAHTGMDVLFHDTFFVVGHFHVMLSGSLMFAGFAGIYFYLPAIFGVRYNRFFAYLHYIYYTIGQLFTVIPMIWLGYSGMPRRVLDYPAVMGGWHSLTTAAHLLTIAGILCFIFMLFDSLIKKKTYIVKTFGVGRYNTRLNFYLYECSRNNYWQGKYLILLKNKVYKNDYYLYNKTKNHELYNPYLYYYILK